MRSLLSLCVVFLTATGCATGRSARVTGEYSDPAVIELLSDRFNEHDLQLIAKRMSASLAETRHFRDLTHPPRLVVGRITNATGETIDVDALADKLQLALFQSGRFELLDKRARQAIAEEYEYQQSGYVVPAQAKGPGGQLGADYIVTGSMSAITQQNGADKLVYYKVSMVASDLETGVIRWAEEKEIRKKLELGGVSDATASRLKTAGLGLSGAAFATGTGLLIAGLAHGRPEERDLEFYDCPNPVSGDPGWTCSRWVTTPGRGPDSTLTWTGAGLMIGAPVLAILTLTLVPDGNPALSTAAFVPASGGGAFVFTTSF